MNLEKLGSPEVRELVRRGQEWVRSPEGTRALQEAQDQVDKSWKDMERRLRKQRRLRNR